MEDRINNIAGKKVAFLTLGCKVNSYETEAMQQLFVAAGAEVKAFTEKADIYVVNTCTVTNIADRKSRQMLHKAKHMNSEAVVVAVGCYAQASKEDLENDDTIDIVIGNNRKKDIITIVNEYYNDRTSISVVDIENEDEYEDLKIETVAEKTRAYIKIQDGCNQFCSYCIIPYARGRIRSRKAEEVVAEVERLVANGYKEVVLTGIHLSSYGLEKKSVLEQSNLKTKDGSNPLLDLIVALCKIDGLERIRFGSLEPRIITDEFVKTLSESPKVCPHFHLSLQSGAKDTLKRMNRKYTPDEYYEKCEIIRKYYDHPAITTDVIVGFPGETEEEFKETKTFLRKVSFAQMHVFKYSKRKGTTAEAMKDQVNDPVKAARSEELIALEEQMRNEYRDQLIGTEAIVLAEEEMEIDGITYMTGHTERYVRVAFLGDASLAGSLVNVRILKQLNKEMMLSEIID
ncbi:MAG: tRNA (N(6)-L-threonylcarbamoyladenosine(37)-C(2))-methylthiotransferase MtaB [Lachnospiraceae bacterium]|nr:tRNA (N(6)-L-threonylcarbamoyladenosine(37)-C(2))-methylthiotransferase MtaB [Lachnospiraceae bacterium]